MKPLLLLNAAVVSVLILIEFIHTDAHRKMEMDVHGYCRQNAEHQKNLEFNDDDW